MVAFRPELVTDVMGYNSGVGGRMTQNSYNWVGDLIVEADVTVNNPAGGDVVFELSKGVDRFQARFTLADGTCTLVRIAGGKETTPGAKPTDLGKSGKHHVRFSNVDGRLTLWVDLRSPSATASTTRPPSCPTARTSGPPRSQLQTELASAPASIGVQTADVSVAHLQLLARHLLHPGRRQ